MGTSGSAVTERAGVNPLGRNRDLWKDLPILDHVYESPSGDLEPIYRIDVGSSGCVGDTGLGFRTLEVRCLGLGFWTLGLCCLGLGFVSFSTWSACMLNRGTETAATASF